jgi:hypothetical protein
MAITRRGATGLSPPGDRIHATVRALDASPVIWASVLEHYRRVVADRSVRRRVPPFRASEGPSFAARHGAATNLAWGDVGGRDLG